MTKFNKRTGIPTDKIIQIDEYLKILKTLSIPVSNIDELEASNTEQFHLIFNKTLNKLRIYDVDNSVWKDATPVDLSNYYTKTEIDDLLSPINVSLIELLGLNFTINQSTSELAIRNNSGDVLSSINLGFLNNEGTSFVYNSNTNSLDLLNDNEELLATIPISSFISNIASSFVFNAINKHILELKDNSGNVLSSVSITIDNVENLQTLLDNKQTIITILPFENGGLGFNTIDENSFIIGSNSNSLIKKTPQEIINILLANSKDIEFTQINDKYKANVIVASNDRLISTINGLDLTQILPTINTTALFTKFKVDNYGRITETGNIDSVDIANIVGGVGQEGFLVNNGTTIITRSVIGSTGKIIVENQKGIDDNIIIDLAPTGVIPGNYTSVTVDSYGRITFGTNVKSEYYVKQYVVNEIFSMPAIRIYNNKTYLLLDSNFSGGNFQTTDIVNEIINGQWLDISTPPDASETQRGLVNIGTQTFAGNKIIKGGATGNPFEVRDNNNVSKLLVTTNGIEIGKNIYNETHIGSNSANVVIIKPANYNFYFSNAGALYGTMPILKIGAASDYDVIHLYPTSNATFGRMLSVRNKLHVAGQSGLGIETPVASAKLQVESTTQGFLPPRMTQSQREAISLPATGLVVYQTDNDEGVYLKKSNSWLKIGGIELSEIPDASETQRGLVSAGTQTFKGKKIIKGDVINDNILEIITSDGTLKKLEVLNTSSMFGTYTTLRGNVAMDGIQSNHLRISSLGTPGGNDGANIVLRQADGTFTTPASGGAGRVIAMIKTQKYNDSSFKDDTVFTFISGGTFTIAQRMSQTDFNSALQNVFSIKNGNIGIGTTTPSAQLEVIGTAKADEFIIRDAASGNINTRFGFEALLNQSANTQFSTAFGNRALKGQTTGTGNTGIGKEALLSNTTGSSNTVVGEEALRNGSGGSNNVAIGNSALKYCNSSNNVAVGVMSLVNVTSGSSNTSVGKNSGFTLNTGSENTFFGESAGAGFKTGYRNVVLGALAADYQYNTGVGQLNTIIGYKAGRSLTEGVQNVLLGAHAMENANYAAYYNIAIGYQAGKGLDAGNSNVIIGTNSATGTATGYTNNVIIGVNSGGYTTNPSYNTYIGDSAGFYSKGINNVCLGKNSGNKGSSLQSVQSDRNTFIGNYSGESTAGSGNVFIGYYSGYNLGTVNNKLHIHNIITTNPLIGGDFDLRHLKFNINNLNLSNLPTTSIGLVAGDVWNDAGTLKII